MKTATEIVLEEFCHIAEIPRPSGHEERIGQYLLEWAAAHELSARRDRMGTIIIDKPASRGRENVPLTILQAHQDMVCIAEKSVKYDPLLDGIAVINDGEFLWAEGTSLGADDGIGMAICLYFLQDSTIQHGPLRAIFTVKEETTLAAKNLDAMYLNGKYLINLDWEKVGSLCNSSAGGAFFCLNKRVSVLSSAAPDNIKMGLHIDGLSGGHSGVDIQKGRSNAIVAMAFALLSLVKGKIPFQISAWSGGHAVNAIPVASCAEIVVPAEMYEAALVLLRKYERAYQAAFAATEPNLHFQYGVLGMADGEVFPAALSRVLTELVCILPNGVFSMSPHIPELVECSSNLGVLCVEGGNIRMECFARSSEEYPMTRLLEQIRLLSKKYGFRFRPGEMIPGWAVDPQSYLTEVACREYLRLTGQPMKVEPIHAGLECGAFASKNPELDMIAIGPTIQNVHTAQEKCRVADIEITVELVKAILHKIESYTSFEI